MDYGSQKLQRHDTATMKDISEDNDISVKQLKQWVREERLTFTDKSPVGIECENCGAMIRTGRFCNKCKNNMANDLRQAYAPARFLIDFHGNHLEKLCKCRLICYTI